MEARKKGDKRLMALWEKVGKKLKAMIENQKLEETIEFAKKIFK